MLQRRCKRDEVKHQCKYTTRRVSGEEGEEGEGEWAGGRRSEGGGGQLVEPVGMGTCVSRFRWWEAIRGGVVVLPHRLQADPEQ